MHADYGRLSWTQALPAMSAWDDETVGRRGNRARLLEAICEPGRRATGSATATVSMGAGLELALARRLARVQVVDLDPFAFRRGFSPVSVSIYETNLTIAHKGCT